MKPPKRKRNPSQASRDHGKPLAFLEGLFASGGWGGYPLDPLEMGREADSCGCYFILGRASVPRHKFRAIAKSGFDIISKASSIGRIYWHQATNAVK